MDSLLFESLCREVEECSHLACLNQGKTGISYKEDGSVVTETDLLISKRISALIRKLAPQCNIVSEEEKTVSFNPDAPYTFVLDPIDGTNVYSQGFDSWCVSLGILDNKLKPVGAIISAPRFGMFSEGIFITSAPQSMTVLVNDKPAPVHRHNSIPRQLTIGSDTLESLDISAFRGKIRTFGSGILHLLSPALFSGIDGCVAPVCYPWDTASSHAVLLKTGYRLVYTDGRDVVYTPKMLTEKTKLEDTMYAAEDVSWMLANFRKKTV